MNAEERVLSRIKPEELVFLKINEETEYLCQFDEENRNIMYGLENNTTIEDWFLGWNVETLKEIKLSKMTSYTLRSLEPHEIEEFERVKTRLLRAKMYAMNYWENQVYKKHIP